MGEEPFDGRDACASLWRSNHRRAATNAAAVAVDAALQNRIGRRDLSGKRLWQETFGLSDPAPKRPRLRVHPPDGSETYTSMQEGGDVVRDRLLPGVP